MNWDIILDFVDSWISPNGKGFFEDDYDAIVASRKMSKNARHKYRRYGLVPLEFLEYLKWKHIIPESLDLNCAINGRSVNDLIEFLWNCPYENEVARDAGFHIRHMLMSYVFGLSMHSMTGSSHLWESNAGKHVSINAI